MKEDSRPNSHWGVEVRARLAEQVEYIRHWKIHNASYSSLRNRKATWFCDPPYAAKHGRCYRFNQIDFQHLGAWCRERRGQVIVCESPGADWLPFKEAGIVRSANGHNLKGWSREMLWTQAV
jgi:16S rRNA G966 N2-methylase RsmD